MLSIFETYSITCSPPVEHFFRDTVRFQTTAGAYCNLAVGFEKNESGADRESVNWSGYNCNNFWLRPYQVENTSFPPITEVK